MARIPQFGSPGWALIGGSLLLALIGLGSTLIGVGSLLSPSNDRVSDVLYLVVGILFIVIAFFTFTAALKYDDPPASLFPLAIDSEERIAREANVNQFTPNEREILDGVKTNISRAPSSAEVMDVLNRKSSVNLVLANSSLQPIAFAIRPATPGRYFKGVVLETLTWVGVVISIPFIFVIDLWRGGRTVMYVALRLSRRARQYRARPDKIFRKDARAPVLYLRSFLDEYETSVESYLPTTSEEKLAKHYHQYGPVIAIGRPKEHLPLLGSSRLYFDQDVWQAGVLYLMSVSQLIIIQAGIAPGLLWELGCVRQRCQPDKLIISFTAWEELDEPTRDLEYRRFKKYAEELLGCELPSDINTTSHISFRTNWLPTPQSEFRYAIPSIRRKRGRIRKIAAATILVFSSILTFTLGRPFLHWAISKVIKRESPTESLLPTESPPPAETPRQWNHYRLKPAPMAVDAPSEPQPFSSAVLEAKENDFYRYNDNDLNAVMGYMRFSVPGRINEDWLKHMNDDLSTFGATNLNYKTTKTDKGMFATEGQFMFFGKKCEVRSILFQKGQEVWFIRVFYPSDNGLAYADAQHMLHSLTEERR